MGLRAGVNLNLQQSILKNNPTFNIEFDIFEEHLGSREQWLETTDLARQQAARAM